MNQLRRGPGLKRATSKLTRRVAVATPTTKTIKSDTLMSKGTYKAAGVDLDVYRESMSRLPQYLARTFSPRVIPQPGGFAGLFRLDFDNPAFARNYEDPVLVSCSDGVGTKLKVAQRVGRHDTIGIDLVAMSVNDAICLGAEPLFFLDYVAMSQDDPDRLEQIVAGISAGCMDAGCALLGGETAIMPDLYQADDYDVAGFCVGVVERRQLIDGKAIFEGDVVLGVASSGLHSNGYSLARKVVFELAGLDPGDAVEQLDGLTVGDALLEPTRILRSTSSTTASPRRCHSHPRPGACHGRRTAREPHSHSSRSLARSDPSHELARAARVHLAASAGRNRTSGNAARVQHGNRADRRGGPTQGRIRSAHNSGCWLRLLANR